MDENRKQMLTLRGWSKPQLNILQPAVVLQAAEQADALFNTCPEIIPLPPLPVGPEQLGVGEVFTHVVVAFVAL